MSKSKAPSPELIFNTINAYQRTEALRGAIDLGLFTEIAKGATTTDALAKQLDAPERGVRILCDYLVVAGFLTKADHSYGLTPDTALFLDKSSPAYVGVATRFLLAPDLAEAFRDVAGTVRKGGTLMEEDGSVTAENPLWIEFARGMAPLIAPSAQFIAELVGPAQGPIKVLDIAAGHGLFGIYVAQKNPEAMIFAVDWPAVLEVATENAQAAGVADRHHLKPGSAFEVDYGTDYDLVLLTNFFHHFDVPMCTELARRVYGALKPGGRAMTLEFVPNDDRVSPPDAAMFSLTMLCSTPRGDAYTFAQYKQIFEEAGFSKHEIHPAPGMTEAVIISHK